MISRKVTKLTRDKCPSRVSTVLLGITSRRRRNLSLSILLAVISSLFFARALAGFTNSGLSKEEIEAKHAEALKRLDHLHWALETSSLFLARLPESVTSVSSPLYNHLHTSRKDPFDESRDLRWTPFPVQDKLFLWSVGPDQQDDGGLIEYDPTNGIISRGDIVWIVRDFSHPSYNDTDKIPYYPAASYFEQDHQQEKLRQFVRDVEYLQALISVYIGEMNAFPQKLEDLFAMDEVVGQLPEDPYRPGQLYGYRIAASSEEALVYSVGPDGTDNEGVSLIYSTSTVPVGDIAARVALVADGYTDRTEEVGDELLSALLKMREETGKDNALIYYQQGALLDLPQPDIDALKTTLKNGWSAESEPLLAYFRIYQPAFDLIRRGVALRQAAMLDPRDQDFSTPNPNLLFANTSVKLLCAQGLYSESLAEPERALEDYRTALQMGQDYGCENASLSCGLMMVALEDIALRHLDALVVSGELDEPQLARVSKVLQEIESGNRPLTAFVENELRMKRAWLQKTAAATPKDSAEKSEMEMIKALATLEEESLDYSSTPRWERTAAMWEEQIKEFEKRYPCLHRMMIPNYINADTHLLVTRSRIRIVRTAVALEQFKKVAGHYPEDISFLIPEYLPEMPIDPFMGSPLSYRKVNNGYQVYGIGPDLGDQGTAVRYDPTNGTISEGDIFF